MENDFACLRTATQSPGKVELGLLPGLAVPVFVCRGRCGHISPACGEKLSPTAYERDGRQGNCRWAFFQVVKPALLGSTAAAEHDREQVLQACNVSY